MTNFFKIWSPPTSILINPLSQEDNIHFHNLKSWSFSKFWLQISHFGSKRKQIFFVKYFKESILIHFPKCNPWHFYGLGDPKLPLLELWKKNVKKPSFTLNLILLQKVYDKIRLDISIDISLINTCKIGVNLLKYFSHFYNMTKCKRFDCLCRTWKSKCSMISA